MKFVVLYGPPAAGKLTVARELSAMTGYRLFHNHLTIEPVRVLFEYGSEPYNRLVVDFRRQLVAEAAASDVDLIYTFVVATERGKQNLEELCNIVEERGGTVCLTNLVCTVEALYSRLQTDDRVSKGKLTAPEGLARYLEEGVLTNKLSKRESFVLDNTDIEPGNAASLIADHFDLKRL